MSLKPGQAWAVKCLLRHLSRWRRIQQSNAGDGSSLPESRGADVANADVGELVVKAKKAAASLWMILHAQVSFNGNLVF
jgi:hypothetical protein